MQIIPKTLEPEYVASRLKRDGGVRTLNRLADRGIFLNTWQVNELLLDGDRGYGKTFLAYVRIAESLTVETFSLTTNDSLERYDKDATTSGRKVEFLKGLHDFMLTYLADSYKVVSTDYTITITPITSTTAFEGIHRWWEKHETN